MKSIIQSKKECYISGTVRDLHKHHIFYGRGKRGLSEQYGLWVYLTANLHTGSAGVHFNKNFDTSLKQHAQRKAMKHYGWSREEFIKIFGRNYL